VSGADPDGRDAIAAAERTDLAWHRSGLALLGCGAVILRGIGRPPLSAGNTAVGVYVLLLGAIVAFLGAWFARGVKQRGDRRTTVADLAPIAIGVACVGVAAFVVAARTV
jgi:uncharacterized membrane protein YidH (DUF202 family)